MAKTVEEDVKLGAQLESLRLEKGQTTALRKWRRWRLPVALLVIFTVGGWMVAGLSGRPVAVEVIRAERLDPKMMPAVPVLSGAGYVVTGERYISIGVRVPGRIERYFVEEGQSVKKDDPLVKLDDRDYRAAVSRAEAALAVARANYDLAEAELRRGRELRGKKVISEQEFDVLTTRAAVSRAQVQQAEAELHQAQVHLEYTTLRAPADGVILAKLKEVGEVAVPGGFAGAGDLIRIANLNDMRAEVDVNEADLARIRIGQPAWVTADAYPDRPYDARVVKLYPQVDRQKGTLKIEVKVLEPDQRLLPDMSVRVTFLEPLPRQQISNPPVTVPAAAVRRAVDGRESVWVVREGRAVRVPVEVARPTGDPARVLSGLSAGEEVIVSDDSRLEPGAAVVVASRR